MEPTKRQPEQDRARYAFNLTLAAVAGQVGCLTLVIVIAALFGGLWLDARFGTKPIFTVGLVIASVPVTLAGMIWIVRVTTSRISPSKKASSEQVEGEN
jgi:MFS-type transporter involved in bile tolerance (Atg22 family)